MTIYRFELPVKLTSEANSSDYWTKKKKRKDAQKVYIDLYCKNLIQDIILPCTITLIRRSPRQFDDDNLTIAFKTIRDRLAQLLFPGSKPGQKDSDKRIKWIYLQEKNIIPKQHSIIIQIEDVS